MKLVSDIFQHTNQFQINYLKPFGLEILAKQPADFNGLVSGKLIKELVKTFSLVLLRGFNPIEKNQLVDYAKNIGPLLEWEFGNVMEMRAQEKPANYLFTHGHVPFHWDGAFHQEPRFLLFHCIEAPLAQGGGETLFADTQLVWRQASVYEKKDWSQRALVYETEKLAHYGGKIKVNLVQTHPDSHETVMRFAEPVPATMLNPVSVSVDGLDEKHSEDLINSIADRCYQNSVCYSHTWQQHDLLLADNHALIHARRAFTEFSPRHLRRIQII